MPAKRAAANPKPNPAASAKSKPPAHEAPPAHETSTVDVSANSASSIEDTVNRAQAAQ
jgi:hypothetical protein